jgi:FkbM family methyltransferase
LPIIAGPLRGRWWLPAARGKILRVLGGSYEREQTELFERWIEPGQTVVDVGAHVGYYSLLASVLVGESGSVHAFEPDRRNARFLRRHVRMNRRSNVTVVEVAVADRTGISEFRTAGGSGTGRLDAGGDRQVPTIRLDDYCSDRGIAPDVLKIDVEGAEVEVLAGAAAVLSSGPVLFLSTHGRERYARSVDLLGELGYRVEPIPGTIHDASAELLCTSSAG